MGRRFSGTVPDGDNEIVVLNMLPHEVGFQIASSGGILAISFVESVNGTSVALTTIQEAQIISDGMGWHALRLSASGGNCDWTLLTHTNLASMPSSNWQTFLKNIPQLPPSP